MELLYHYLWKHKMLPTPAMTCDGREVKVISPGVHNDNAGPDFSCARLILGEEEWTGNVEIHVKASDWYLHGHDRNPSYDNVILHVVAIDDRRILRADGSEIPQLVVLLPREFYLTYSDMKADMKGVRCASRLSEIPDLNREDWLNSLSMERLHSKARRILDWLQSSSGDWEQTMFIAMARALGFNLNAVPFEILASSLPLKYVYHHSDSRLQIEALLFGQAGMLDSSENIFDDYYQALCREYYFLARKYSLRPIRRDIWKFARTRPNNFPHRRIALMAEALYSGTGFTSLFLNARGDTEKLSEAFSWELHDYWKDHFVFGSDPRKISVSTSLSNASRRLIMINVAAPFYFAYANSTGDFELADYGADILTSLPPEENTIITSWTNSGISPENAMRSQALLHLRNEYCDRDRCLECRFGHHLLRSKTRIQTES